MYRSIQDYAIIGNLRSAVLVSKDGSIDWACAPFIDSPSVFAALLDYEKGGSWSIAPSEEYTAHQRYVKDTNILVTKFITEKGVLEVTDFLPIESERLFVPAEENTTFRIHRRIACTRGSIRIRVVFNPRFDYARGETTISHLKGGLSIQNGTMKGVLQSDFPFSLKDNSAIADAELHEGEVGFQVFRFNKGEVVLREEDMRHHEEELEEARRYWQDWVHNCDQETCPVAGEWHAEVVRSSLLLKILFFEPVGTIAAAPTTSLPETIGGERNWDYRFTWVRDSSFTLMALFRLGYFKESEEYINWVIDICHKGALDDLSHLQAIYGLRGEMELTEETLDHLEGYKGSRPVRIGNGAYKQKQWDIYGSILDMVWTIHQLREEHQLSSGTWKILRGFANHIMKIWREPDEGLWEVRGEQRHYVYSKVMCWVGLDRAVKIAEAHNQEGEIELWKKEKEIIRSEVMDHGWSEKKQSLTQSFDSDDLDASVLTFPALEFIKGDDPKMISTIKAVEQELGVGDGLLLRYNSDDGFSGGEGAFLLASFWLIDALILSGERERAAKLMDKMCALGNHVGLLPEEMNPTTKDFLGNFPQAYTHIGLINSAFNLVEYRSSPVPARLEPKEDEMDI